MVKCQYELDFFCHKIDEIWAQHIKAWKKMAAILQVIF